MKENTVAEFVWVDAFGNTRSKAKVFPDGVPALEKISAWWYDGSSTGQAEGFNSDVFLAARRIYNDPFRKGQKLVLCDVYNDIELTKPNFANFRAEFARLAEKHKSEEVWIGVEQEYIINDRATDLPFGWKAPGEPGWGPQGPYYCAVGSHKIFGREIVEDHLQKCLEAGLLIYGINSEVMPSQWEFQVGTGDALRVCDDLVVGRYILERVTEGRNAYINWDPKPFSDWNGSGAHTNFSTKAMRENGGYVVIEAAMSKLAKTHASDVLLYGKGNERRLTGLHETSDMKNFTWSFGDRGRSVRVASVVKLEGKGYFEDRRPASNMDPYLVLTCLYKSLFESVAPAE